MDAVSTFSDTTLDSSRDLVNITHLFPELGTIESVEILLGTIATPFCTEAEAVRLANSGKSGLGAVVLTQDVTRTLRLTERLEVGMVWVKCWGTREMGMPFGGVKGSGL
jgi:hypothetical protein